MNYDQLLWSPNSPSKMVLQDICHTGLTLGSTSIDSHRPHNHDHHRHQDKTNYLSLKFDHVMPSLTLGLSSDEKDQTSTVLYRQQASSFSAASSYSNSSVKKEKDVISGGEEVEIERDQRCSKLSGGDHDHDHQDLDDQEEEGSTARKKLRLTKEQSVVLEDRFKEHSTLNPKQKQVLAKQLNLRPRQVEVWFQNRRARTKLKQTEVECELLKKCCAALTDENRRLQKEVQELKALKVKAPFCMQMPAATLTMCPSCERIGGSGENSSKSPFSIGAKPHFQNPFTHPSAAC